MKINFKKCLFMLATIFTLSLLLEIGSGVASFATIEEIYKEIYIKNVIPFSECGEVVEVSVCNSKVAECIGINLEKPICQEKDEVTYILSDNGDGFFIEFIGSYIPILYVPDTFFGKPVNTRFYSGDVLSPFTVFSWPCEKNERKFYVPQRLKDSFEDVAENAKMYGYHDIELYFYDETKVNES